MAGSMVRYRVGVFVMVGVTTVMMLGWFVPFGEAVGDAGAQHAQATRDIEDVMWTLRQTLDGEDLGPVYRSRPTPVAPPPPTPPARFGLPAVSVDPVLVAGTMAVLVGMVFGLLAIRDLLPAKS